MTDLTTAKTIEVMFEDALETFESQDTMLNLVDLVVPDASGFQNSGNVEWQTVEQHRPDLSGWDLTGQETGIVEEEYPLVLGVPSNDFSQLRADQLRDKRFWDRAGKAAGAKRASVLNQAIANAIMSQGTMYLRSNVTSGYDFIAETQVIPTERQQMSDRRCVVLNDRDNLKYSKDIASRDLTPEVMKTWDTGMIATGVAGADVFTGSFLPNLVGGADPATTVTGDQTFKPEGGTVDEAAGTVTNVDYRNAIIPVAASASYNVGDKVEIRNGGVALVALGLDDKTETGQPMTFTVKSKPDATHLMISPKPIAADDTALSPLEKAYANVDTVILDTATVNRLNTDATKKSNLFFDQSAIKVVGGEIPAELMNEYEGMRVIPQKMSNGLTMYMIYDGSIVDLTFRFRLFVWYGITVCAPMNCGVAVSY